MENTHKDINSHLYFSGILPFPYLVEGPKNYNGIKEFQSISERIRGKKAIMRRPIMGKRENYGSGRTVSCPNSCF